MFVEMSGLYGMPGYKSYFRETGDCFDFVSDKQFATDLSTEKAQDILKYKDFYLNQFGGLDMQVVA